MTSYELFEYNTVMYIEESIKEEGEEEFQMTMPALISEILQQEIMLVKDVTILHQKFEINVNNNLAVRNIFWGYQYCTAYICI